MRKFPHPEVVDDEKWDRGQIRERRLLREGNVQARAVLQRVVDGRIVFTPSEGGYAFAARTRYDKLFSGFLVPRPSFIPEGDTTGTEGITIEDTFERHYDALLERAYRREMDRRVKRLASPPTIAPFPPEPNSEKSPYFMVGCVRTVAA